jgi:ribosomal protein S24E
MENFKILNEKENLLFNRKEIQVSVEANVTPSKVEVEKLITEKLSTQAEKIKIKNILGRFGSKVFTINVNVYTSKEDKDKNEPKSKKEKAEEKKE